MSDQTDTERRIRDLEDRRYDAVVAGDLVALASVCHSSLLYTHSSGLTDSLESYLKKCREGYYIYHSVEHPIHELVLVGDTAVVLGEMNASVTAGGVTKKLRNSALAVWVRVDDDWKLLAHQPTPKP